MEVSRDDLSDKYLLFLGTIDDGWAIDEQLDKNTQAIITQVQDSCPEKINRGFVLQDLSFKSDLSVNITCVQKELEKKSVKSPVGNNEIEIHEEGQAQVNFLSGQWNLIKTFQNDANTPLIIKIASNIFVGYFQSTFIDFEKSVLVVIHRQFSMSRLI